MIVLSRLNRRPVVVNAELIRSIEANPDTTITMLNGDRIIVREDVATVITRAIDHSRVIRSLVPHARDAASVQAARAFPSPGHPPRESEGRTAADAEAVADADSIVVSGPGGEVRTRSMGSQAA